MRRDIQGTRHGIKIDIFFAIVVKLVEACGVANEACQGYELSGFVVAEKKKELPQKSMIEILGIEVRENGLLVPKLDGMWNLLVETETMIHATRWTKARLPEVLAKSVRDLLLRRVYISRRTTRPMGRRQAVENGHKSHVEARRTHQCFGEQSVSLKKRIAPSKPGESW